MKIVRNYNAIKYLKMWNLGVQCCLQVTGVNNKKYYIFQVLIMSFLCAIAAKYIDQISISIFFVQLQLIIGKNFWWTWSKPLSTFKDLDNNLSPNQWTLTRFIV